MIRLMMGYGFSLLLIVAVIIGIGLPYKSVSAASQQQVTFKQALPGYSYSFPADHASHPEFKTEWWYYTGHLFGKNNKAFGYELTFFRSATGLPKKAGSNWQADNFYLVHFAITDETGKRFYHTAKLNRGAPGGMHGKRAGAKTDNYEVWNEHWLVRLDEEGRHQLYAEAPEFALKLTLDELKPPAIHGYNGISQKADCVGCASHYYSLTRMPSKGHLRIGNSVYEVTGQSWMDHEFGSNQLQPEQTGWDWFSIQLANNEELMLYHLRRDDGTLDRNSSGSWVNPSVKVSHLDVNDAKVTVLEHWTSPHSGGRYPSKWRIMLPSKQLDITVTPVLADQELTDPRGSDLSYWEGRCKVRGTINGSPITGNAYVEMTGYANAFKQKI